MGLGILICSCGQPENAAVHATTHPVNRDRETHEFVEV